MVIVDADASATGETLDHGAGAATSAASGMVDTPFPAAVGSSAGLLPGAASVAPLGIDYPVVDDIPDGRAVVGHDAALGAALEGHTGGQSVLTGGISLPTNKSPTVDVSSVGGAAQIGGGDSGVQPLLQPVAHAVVDAERDVFSNADGDHAPSVVLVPDAELAADTLSDVGRASVIHGQDTGGMDGNYESAGAYDFYVSEPSDDDEAAAAGEPAVGDAGLAVGGAPEYEPDAAAVDAATLDQAAAVGGLAGDAALASGANDPLFGPMPDAPPEAAAAQAADEVLCVCTDFFPETDDEDIDKDRWMTVRTFIAAMLSEPVLNIFAACSAIDVEVLARTLIARTRSAEWIELAPCVTPVVFVWQFLLLVRHTMDEQPDLCQAAGELMLFCVLAEEETMARWVAKAKPAAKEYRDKWADGDAATYDAWLLSLGIRPAFSHVVAREPSKARAAEQANELRTGQSWPGRPVLRAFPEDSTAEKQRLKAAGKREEKKDVKPKDVKGWDVDDCRHHFPDSVLRAPGVITFVCGCGYIIGFELLRETESPAHVVAALVQRFKRFPRVIYFDTACQAQRNALRRVPWMMDGVCTSWFIDRFHRCNHTCSPVFNADQYPDLTRGHDTSGAERQHSIKKRSKNSLSYMRQRRFIVRSRIIAAHNNIKVSQRREATKEANRERMPGRAKVSVEIQHKPVETYFHDFIVDHCEMGERCPCRDRVQNDGVVGLERKV